MQSPVRKSPSRLDKLFRPRTLELFGPNRRRFSPATEISAGITVGLLALPLSLALGIASIPADAATPLSAPALGMLTAILAGLVISLFGGSRVQIGGPTAAFVPIVLLIVIQHGYNGLLLATLMAGGILILMGLCNLGVLIKFIPWPVTSGFTSGIAVAILLTQIPDFAGIAADSGLPAHFNEKIPWLLRHLPALNPAALLLSLVCMLLMFLWPKLGLRRVPGSIVAMLGATVLLQLTGWGEQFGIATIGSRFGDAAIPAGIPRPALPDWDWALIRSLLGPATAIALLGAIESLLSAVVADGLSGDRHHSNTELIAQGMANLISPLFGGLPATGAIARTSANIQNGATTPLAGITHALTLLGVMLIFAKAAAHIPLAAMSAVLIKVALNMGEWHELSRLRRMPRSDALVLATTFGLTVVFDLVIAIQIGMVLAAILYIRRVSETTCVSAVGEIDELETPEQMSHGKTIPQGVRVYRIFGPFLFGAAEKMEDAISATGQLPRVLILQLHLVPAMDATAMNALLSLVERMQKHRGIVLFSGMQSQPYTMLRKSGFVEKCGEANFCITFDRALDRARSLLD